MEERAKEELINACKRYSKIYSKITWRCPVSSEEAHKVIILTGQAGSRGSIFCNIPSRRTYRTNYRQTYGGEGQMNSEDYKMAIRLLRGITNDAMELVEEFGLDAGVIAPILTKEELIEEILTANFIEEDK